MSASLKITVLAGGDSAEREVSLNSAQQVANGLEQKKHAVTVLELDSGCVAQLAQQPPDVVFPVLHGPPGEDGTVQGMLDMLAIPYVGSGVRGSAFAMDKAVAKLIFRRHGLPVAEDVLVNQAHADITAVAKQIKESLGHRVVVKPLNQGSAIGVTPLPNGGDVEAALQAALVYGDCLVEPFVMGKEITVGVLERNDELVPHPVIEITTDDDEWYDYKNRYTIGKSAHVIPARLPQNTQAELQGIAIAAHQALGLRDLSRADFIVGDDDQITLLEVNTLPGMTPTSLYPDGARHLGYEFPDLMDLLVHQALGRHTMVAK